MKYIILSLIFLGCGTAGADISSSSPNPNAPKNCSVTKKDHTTTISCPGQDPVQIEDGTDGTNGKDGTQGTDGNTGVTGPKGDKGETGSNGKDAMPCDINKTENTTSITCNGKTATILDGKQGDKGDSCTVEQGVDFSTLSCEDGRIAVVSNGAIGPQGDKGDTGSQGQKGDKGDQGEAGEAGIDGSNGTPGTTIFPVVACPTNTSGYPEVMLCIDNSLYAVYDSSVPGAVHYAKITPGYYVSTDGRSCYFTLVNGCEIK
jgi:hypothetical protein